MSGLNLFQQEVKFYTAGYNGFTVEVFISALKSKGISVLIDVRFTPYSRKKGFSKNQLKSLLNYQGIEYIHLAELGIEPEYRRDDSPIDAFDFYKNKIESQSESVEKVEKLINKSIVALMCCENSLAHCHRKLLAEKIRSNKGFTFEDINSHGKS